MFVGCAHTILQPTHRRSRGRIGLVKASVSHAACKRHDRQVAVWPSCAAAGRDARPTVASWWWQHRPMHARATTCDVASRALALDTQTRGHARCRCLPQRGRGQHMSATTFFFADALPPAKPWPAHECSHSNASAQQDSSTSDVWVPQLCGRAAALTRTRPPPCTAGGLAPRPVRHTPPSGRPAPQS